MAPQAARPVEVFVSYSHEDDELRAQLETSLIMLRRRGVVRQWSDRRITPGQEWNQQIDEHLESADIILLLVSPDFLASDYCYDIEVTRAMQRHERGEACVIPVILRFTDDWQSALFGKVQALPKDAQPVTDWNDRDKAFADVAAGIRRAVEELRSKQVARPIEEKESATTTFIPRPPVIGFVSRGDSQGRDIVARLKEEFAPGRTQLVTLSGPGGIGKTTLAVETARSLQEAYEHRVVWSSAEARTDFTLLSLLDDIATQLGRADLRTLAPSEKEEQVRVLAAGALVVLDNYETIAATERARIETWFKRTPCSALFTSRPRVPDTVFIPVSAMSREEATEFLERLAAQTQAPQMFTPDVRARVYETAEANPFVMQWVVGQIDLAQAPGAVLEELKHGTGDAALRVFDRSFDLPLLGDDGRAALLALSLFAPSATPDALSAVAGFDDNGRVREAVGNLHRLWLVKGVDGNRRLTVEGLTRSLAAARLSKDPRAAEFQRRFVEYFLRYAEVHSEPTPENYDALEAERENLLGAAETAYTSGEWESVMRLAYVLARPADGMLSVRGYWDEAVRLGAQALQAAHAAKDEGNIAALSHNIAVMYGNRGELAEARRLYEQSLEITKQLGNQSGVAITLHQLGMLAQVTGEIAEARRLYEQSLEITKQLGNQSGVAATLHQLGRLAEGTGEIAEARRLYEQSLEINKKLGNQNGVAITLHQLGMLAQVTGEIAEARRLYEQSLEIEKRLGNQSGVAITLHQLGRLAEDAGEMAEARRLYEQSLEIEKRLGNQSGVARTTSQLGIIHYLLGEFEEAKAKHEESLAIRRKLGEQQGIAIDLYWLGMLAEVAGDKGEAARLFREALSILERLGSPNAEIARQSLARVGGETS